jgi:hypothetical protein
LQWDWFAVFRDRKNYAALFILALEDQSLHLAYLLSLTTFETVWRHEIQCSRRVVEEQVRVSNLRKDAIWKYGVEPLLKDEVKNYRPFCLDPLAQ